MQIRNIHKLLRKVLESWADSIEDPLLKKEVLENSYIAGGALISLFMGQRPNDFDVFFKTTGTAMRVAQYYLDHCKIVEKVSVKDMGDRVFVMIKSAGVATEEGTVGYAYFESQSVEAVEEFVENNFQEIIDAINPGQCPKKAGRPKKGEEKKEEKKPYRPVVITSNAISLSDRIQLIMRFVGKPEDVVPRFDFVHTKMWWDIQSGVHPDALALACIADNERKQLQYVGSPYPLCAYLRTRKFMKRGWYITAGDSLKIILQCAELNLQDVSVLEEQLIGVDVAYFHELIKMIKEGAANGKTIDANYVIKLIDEVEL